MKKPTEKLTLREARLALDLSQEALAERAGMEQTAISKLELGKVKEPLFSTGLALADALELDPHQLRFGSEVSA